MTYWVGICTLPMFLFPFAFNLKLNKYTSFHLTSSFILILLMHTVCILRLIVENFNVHSSPQTFCCYFDRSKIKAFAIILWTKLFVGQPTPPFIRSNGSTITCWSNQSFYPILKSLNSDVKEIGFKYHNTTTESAERKDAAQNADICKIMNPKDATLHNEYSQIKFQCCLL